MAIREASQVKATGPEHKRCWGREGVPPLQGQINTREGTELKKKKQKSGSS